jgi:hypothetical protein
MNKEQLNGLLEGLKHINDLMISDHSRAIHRACIELGALTQWVNDKIDDINAEDSIKDKGWNFSSIVEI